MEHQGCIRAALDRLGPPGPDSARADPGSRMTAGPGQSESVSESSGKGPAPSRDSHSGLGTAPGDRGRRWRQKRGGRGGPVRGEECV